MSYRLVDYLLTSSQLTCMIYTWCCVYSLGLLMIDGKTETCRVIFSKLEYRASSWFYYRNMPVVYRKAYLFCHLIWLKQNINRKALNNYCTYTFQFFHFSIKIRDCNCRKKISIMCLLLISLCCERFRHDTNCSILMCEPVQLVHNFMTMYVTCTTMLRYNGTGRCKGVCFRVWVRLNAAFWSSNSWFIIRYTEWRV
jgi:hypothetical protein